MTEAFICDAVRTPIGRYGGALAGVRTDDLGGDPARGAPAAQRGRGLAGGRRRRSSAARTRRARTTATSRAWPPCSRGCPVDVPGVTVNRLCGSGLDAVAIAARAIRAGEAEFVIAGGVGEHEPRAATCCPRRTRPSAATQQMFDTTIGWRFVNPADEGAIRHRLDAGDRRERRRRVRGLARRPGRLRAAQPAARARRRRRAAGSRRRSLP